MRSLIFLCSLTICLSKLRFLQGTSNTQPDDSSVNLNTSSNFTIKAGESKELSVYSNPTTGYYWYVVDTGYELCQVTSECYVSNSNDSELVGGGGTQYFTFYCDEEAEVGSCHVIGMEYKRYKDVEAEESKEVNYNIE